MLVARWSESAKATMYAVTTVVWDLNATRVLVHLAPAPSEARQSRMKRPVNRGRCSSLESPVRCVRAERAQATDRRGSPDVAAADWPKDASRLETQASRTSPRARSLAERIAKPEES